MPVIYHLICQADWETALSTGEVRPSSLADEGFIHCSRNEAQLLAVAQRLYPGQHGVVVLDVDSELLGSPVKHEPSRSGEIYPHIYGPLNIDAVVQARTMFPGADGSICLA